MNDIAIQARPAPAVIQQPADADPMLAMIERASRDPSVDLDKLERLMAMRERLAAQGAEQGFNEAMKAAQAEMTPISADASNPQTRSKYASYAKLDAALRPIYTRHGFSVSFDEADSPKPEHIRCLAYVSHASGHTRTYRKDMPADGKGAKGGDVMTKTHAVGAAASYGQRYLLKGIFNVAVGEDDRDGNTAGTQPITEAQRAEITKLIDGTGADIRRFCAAFGVAAVADLTAAAYPRAVQMLNAKKAKA